MSWHLVVNFALAMSEPPFVATPHADDGLPPGGYRRLGDMRRTEPPDGREYVMMGSAITALGLLRIGASTGLLVAAAPSRCPGETAYFNTLEDCRAMRTYAWVGAGMGAALLVSGVVFVTKGALARREHRKWRLYGGGWAAGDVRAVQFGVTWRP